MRRGNTKDTRERRSEAERWKADSDGTLVTVYTGMQEYRTGRVIVLLVRRVLSLLVVCCTFFLLKCLRRYLVGTCQASRVFKRLHGVLN